MKHLTDDQLQSHLDQSGSDHKSPLGGHLRGCETCRERLASYRRLYVGLKQDRGYELNAGFADSVMTRLAAAAPAPAPGRSWEWWLAGTGLAAALSLVAYFVDLSALMTALALPFAPMVQTSQDWLTATRGTLASFSGYTIPLALSGATLLTVKVAENLLWAIRDKRLFHL